jgi:hypothetical protein
VRLSVLERPEAGVGQRVTRARPVPRLRRGCARGGGGR